MPILEQARDYALHRLQNELSPKLTYHCLEHTLRVARAAEQLITLEGISEDIRLLLLTAVYYHDLGFIQQRLGHEMISIQLAEQNLPKFGYSEAQIAIIRGIIQATHIPQSPTNLIEMIMADADLDYLGQDDFWQISQDLRHELENYDKKFTDEEWYAYQLSFIVPHQYFTPSARALRDSNKQRHVVEIQERLKATLDAKLAAH